MTDDEFITALSLAVTSSIAYLIGILTNDLVFDFVLNNDLVVRSYYCTLIESFSGVFGISRVFLPVSFIGVSQVLLCYIFSNKGVRQDYISKQKACMLQLLPDNITSRALHDESKFYDFLTNIQLLLILAFIIIGLPSFELSLRRTSIACRGQLSRDFEPKTDLKTIHFVMFILLIVGVLVQGYITYCTSNFLVKKTHIP